MKRITYISEWATDLSALDVREIGAVAAQRNKLAHITGVLVCWQGYFFQVIEGPEKSIDSLYSVISRDPRHRHVLCLKTESKMNSRLFPDWSMRTIDLDQETGVLVQPVRVLVQTVIESHGTIERYTQPALRRIIESGRNPISLPPTRQKRILVMSDIFGFSTISERFPVEEVGALASLYLDTCFEEVHARGGEITKFIGDSVLAYFPETAAEEAIDCAMAILQRFREIRRSSPRGSAPAILHAGFGMSAGQVLEGTVGSTGKLDYTVLGDAVNTAARIESMTRQLGYNILVTKDIAGGASPERKFVSLGHHTLKGKSIRVHLLSVDSPLAKELPLRSLA